MNPKIKELRDKSLEKYVFTDIDGDNNHGIRLNEEKFAELIIRECVEVAYSYDEPKMSGCGLIIGNSIETHFGIE